MSEFFRFPHTPHLAWLAPGEPRGDKVMTPAERQDFLKQELWVEEKLDGANLGFSVDDEGELQAQNRGSYLNLTSPPEQFKKLPGWLVQHRRAVEELLFPDLMLFGEWCYARHSVAYNSLPDWFLAFDLYDRKASRWLSPLEREALLAQTGLFSVPKLGQGHFSLAELEKLMGQSHWGHGPAEGLVAKALGPGAGWGRAKLVRPDFLQALGAHWSKGALVAQGTVTWG